MSIAQKTANILIDIGAVTFRFNPPFTFTSGLKSPIYLDNRLVMSYTDKRKKIVSLYIDMINKLGESFDYISATATAAIPQGAWIARDLNIPMVYCRSSKKGHGKENQIEGYLKKGSRVLIVEDHVSTAGSAVANAKAVRELGGKVEHIVATTTYETEKSIQQMKDAGLTLHALTTGKIIVEQAVKHSVISREEKILVDEWFADPTVWGQKQRY